jgi:DNA-binding LacI/PurR family transcriptional regulator
MVHLLEKHITANGFNLMLMRTPNEVKDLVNATGNIAVDGAIAIDMQSLVDEFRSHPTVPCVSISPSEQLFVDNVTVDLSAGVDEAMDVMLNVSRKRISYLVTAPNMEHESEVRAGTYLAARRKAKRKPGIINVWPDETEEVERNFKLYVQEHGCPGALFCQNDQTAMFAFRVLSDLGYVIPTDVLLVGCDGQRHMRNFNPPLSTFV